MTLRLNAIQVGKGYTPNEEGVSTLSAKAHIDIATGEEEDSRVFSHVFTNEESLTLLKVIEDHISEHINIAASDLAEIFNDNAKLLKEES